VSRTPRRSYTGLDTFNDDFDKNFNRGIKGMFALMFLYILFIIAVVTTVVVVGIKVLQNTGLL
jgi:hypothetical protein